MAGSRGRSTGERRAGGSAALGLVAALGIALGGCSGVQRAVISPVVEMQVASASGATSGEPAAPMDPVRVPNGRRWIVRSDRSQLSIVSGDLFGSYTSALTRYRGIFTMPEAPATAGGHDDEGHVALVFDMTSLRSGSKIVTAILQLEFLEVDVFPTATLDARVRRTSAEDCVVDGILELHGHRRHVSFKGQLVRSEAGYRFTSTFDLDRHAFDIRRHDHWDWTAKDDFRVTIDLSSSPEHVRAEEIDGPPGAGTHATP